jgi:hypothetical protein
MADSDQPIGIDVFRKEFPKTTQATVIVTYELEAHTLAIHHLPAMARAMHDCSGAVGEAIERHGYKVVKATVSMPDGDS